MLSRNLYSKAILSQTLKQKFRGKSIFTKNDDNDKFNLLSNINRHRRGIITSKIDKQSLIDDVESRALKESLKRKKYAEYIDASEEIEPPLFDICSLFDTGFEDDCDYIQYTGILGSFTILQNFESFDEGDTIGDVYLYELEGFFEDFESFDEGDTNIDVYLFV